MNLKEVVEQSVSWFNPRISCHISFTKSFSVYGQHLINIYVLDSWSASTKPKVVGHEVVNLCHSCESICLSNIFPWLLDSEEMRKLNEI